MDKKRIDHLISGQNKRRDFVRLGLFGLAVWPLQIEKPIQRLLSHRPTFTDHPFQLGVASGEPSSDGFVIWTRLAPKPLEGGGMPHQNVQVQWQVALDEQMTDVVSRGSAVASPELGHSIHVEVEGLLPDRWYFYQFKAGSDVSQVGRSKTAPTRKAMVDQFRFAFASCQHYEQGYYTALDHMSKEDLDLVIHLGDYIYEYEGREERPRKHIGGEINSLDEYRQRYAQYKMDPALQAVHANFPWLVTWDDHEFDNNYANAVSEESGIDPVAFLKRRANAYQAYYENMPLRKRAIPTGPNMSLYRKVSFGRLIAFNVLDTRQYRTDQPCGDKSGLLCEEAFNPEASMLGNRQERWLRKQLNRSKSTWNVLAQQVMMAKIDRDPTSSERFSVDQWSGYDVSRKAMMQLLADPKISNPIVLTGDIHSNWVNNLKVDPFRPEEKNVGVEFVGTSITSGGDGEQIPEGLDGILSDNPSLVFHSRERGYVSCQVNNQSWRSDYQAVEYVTTPDAPLITRASFAVENGTRKVHKIAGD